MSFNHLWGREATEEAVWQQENVTVVGRCSPIRA